MPAESPGTVPSLRAALANFRVPLVIYLLVSLAVAGVGFFVISGQRDELRRGAEEDLLVLAKIKTQAIRAWLDDRQSDAQLMARRLETARDAEIWFTGGAAPEAQQMVIRLRAQAMQTHPVFRRISFADSQGKAVLAGEDGASVFTGALLAAIREAARTGQIQTTALRGAAAEQGSAHIHMVAPVVLGQGATRRVAGVVILNVDPNIGLFQIVEENAGHAPSAETLIVGRDGDYIAFLSRRRGATAAILEQRQPISAEIPAAKALQGFEGIMRGRDYRGVDVLAAVASVPDSPWHVVAKVDVDDVLAPARRMEDIARIVGVALLAAGGGLLLIGWRRQQALIIVQRQAAEERAQESEVSLRAALNNLREGYMVVGFDWTILFANEAAARQSRRTREEMVGRKLPQVYPGVEQTEIFAAYRRTMEERTPEFMATPYTFEDGVVRWYEIYIDANDAGISVLFLDITARRMAEEEAQRLSRVVAATWDSVISTDIDGTVTSWNPSAERMFGYSAAEMIGQKITILAPPDDPGVMHRVMERVWAGERLTDIEAVRYAKNGKPVDISLTVSPVMANDGTVAGISAIARDITERKRLQREVARGAEILAAEHDLSPDGILVVDQQDRIVSFNSRFAEICGLPEQLRGDGSEIGVARLASDPSTQSEAFLARARHLREGGAEGDPENAIGEVLLPDGSIYERRSVPLVSSTSGFSGRVWYFRDITLHKRHVETAARLAAIVQMSADAIVSMDVTGHVTSWNAAAERLFGYSAAEIAGKNIALLAIPEHRAEVARRIAAAAAGQAVPEYEGVRVRKDGREIVVASRVSPLGNDAGKITGVSAIIRDITERKQAERALQHVSRALRTLSLANKALVHATTSEGFYQRMCDIIVNEGGYRMAWVGLKLDDAEKNVSPVAVAGHDDGYVAMVKASWDDVERGHGPTGNAIRENRIQINQAFATNPSMAPWRENALRRGYNSSIAVPLHDGDRAFGAITIYAPEPDAFGPEEATLLSDLGDDLSYGVVAMEDRAAREKAGQRLELAMEQTVQAVATTVEMRDPYTAGHQRSVALIAQAIASKLGLAPDRIHALRLASIVHDLGKINIPAEILTKPAKLTDLEYAIIKTHPQTGYDILRNVDFPWPIAEIVFQHHEKIDGSGYPNGLKGDAILQEAKILCVADVVESIMSHRPYRPALGVDAALDEIRAGRGRLYDPAVVDACEVVMLEQAAKPKEA